MTDADLGPTAPPVAPPVVAVVVTRDPGDWFEETLAALAASDYPNLSVLVVDAASDEDPTPRVAAVLPNAFVRRLDRNEGFGPSANDVLGVVEGASHFVFLHDDAAPDPDAIRLLVEEAYRSNAGIVAPKLVDWDDGRVLVAVGAGADKTGMTSEYGRGELDQEQHDPVRDVFVAPSGCQLVRADLFATLHGFDPAIPFHGEDVNLCWRAHVAGARVVVAPSARVRHREAASRGERPVPAEVDADPLRHRIRTVLTAYGPLHLVWVLPQLAAVLAIEAAISGRKAWRATAQAWRWNVSQLADVRAQRQALREVRLVRDSEIRGLQGRGSARLAAALRGGLEAEERTLGVGEASRELAGAITRGGVRLTAAVWLSLAVVLLIGSRELLTGPLPAIGQIVPFPDSPLDPLRLFASGWRTTGLGSESPAPFALALLGAGGALLAGGMGVLQKVLVLGALPIGIVGAHRLMRPIGSWRPRLAGGALYAAVPLPYDALARGRWPALVAYAAMPWIAARVLHASGLPPFGAPAPFEDDHARRRRRRRAGARTPSDAIESLLGAEAGTFDAIDTEELRLAAIAVAGRAHDHDDADPAEAMADPPSWVRWPATFLEQAVAAALVVAVAVALAPPVALAVAVFATGLLVGGLVAGPLRAALRMVALAVAALAGAALLLVPWTFELAGPGATWEGIAGLGVPPPDASPFEQLLTLHTGDMRAGPFAFGLLGAAALSLLIGRRWRFDWAARLWVVALAAWALAWTAGRGWLGVAPPAADVLLAPAAVAMVLAAALGLASFEVDLPGYRFGWRQLATALAAVAGAASLLPVLAAAVDGRWSMPDRDHRGLLSWMGDKVDEGDFRVLWLAAPDVLPGDGWVLSDGLAYGASRNGTPEVDELWAGSDGGTTGLLADALSLARRGETTRLGRLLGPLGVRYVVVAREAAPHDQHATRREPPEGVVDALLGQLDLRLVDTDESLVLFENAAWAPIRAGLPAGSLSAAASSSTASTGDVSGAPPVLDPGSWPLRSTGPVPAGDVYVAEGASSRWRLTVDGDGARREKAFGWANGFTVERGGRGSLVYRTSPVRYAGLLLELALWLAALRIVIGAVRRRAAHRRSEDDDAGAEVGS